MSLLQPAASQAMSPSALNDSTCRIQHVVPTAAIFAAALERLNRKSALTLFRELAQELDEHGRLLTDASRSSKDVSSMRAELVALLALLRQTTEQHQREVALIKQQLVELQEQSTKAQADFETHLGTLISMQIDQHLARAFATASARQEQSVSAALDRELKPVTTRLMGALASREQPGRRSCLLLLLGLFLASLLFMLGLFTARRTAGVSCPPVAAAAAGVGAASGAAQVAAIVPPKSASASAAMALVPTKSEAPAKAGSSQLLTLPLALSGIDLRPGSMEAEMLEYLRRPGPRSPRTFIMDRLWYPPRSHEVNPEGKEQLLLLAKLLSAYPSVQIEIRGHNDGTESEIYTGPNPIRGYSLSELRANCVSKRLQGLKVPAKRLQVRGLGSTQPLADDRSEEGRQHNRRVEIVVRD